MSETMVRGFPVRLDLAYDLQSHMWVEVISPDRVRIGMDSLGLETSGTLAQLSFVSPGVEVAAGEMFGSIEAEKFVGVLAAPVAGKVASVNADVVAAPGLAERDPYGAGWFIELEPSDLEGDLVSLVSGPEAVETAFADRYEQYRIEGVLAE